MPCCRNKQEEAHDQGPALLEEGVDGAKVLEHEDIAENEPKHLQQEPAKFAAQHWQRAGRVFVEEIAAQTTKRAVSGPTSTL